MNIRLYNARILSMREGSGIEEGEVWVEGSHIAYMGPRKDTETVWDREIDVKGNVVMPGFKNAHTHSAMTFLRSYADDMPLMDWLDKQVFPMEAKLTPDDMYHLSRLAVMEYVTSGITANFDMYMDPVSVAKASADCGFRTVLCGAMNNFSQSLKEEEQWYKELNSYHELIRFCFGAHAEYTTSMELLQGLAGLARKYKTPVYLHNSETREEVEQCIGRYGKTPTVLLDSLGIYDYGGGGYHCVHMTEEDLDIFTEKGLYVVTNPGSNTKLASGIAPIRKMMDKGIPIAIGTDGPASNNCLDMFREMFLVTGLAKLREHDASAVDAADVLRMATVNGAHAMGLKDCDVLAEGKCADLIIVDLHQPNMQPLNNITKNIVYSGSKQNIVLTMVNGSVLYENGTFHIGAEPEEVYAKANEIIGRMR
ncbi:5-methylthioadenosine/S-adenosylhomocysteine deaminase [Lachnospiraceae bacterium]|uniref:amidohydrolase n=1 Tax=Extibacter sp. GGCC_0201 TaxID=2731209 RepID=UPI001AA111F8|nr:amidohydrolase [Extibacter sp. GGCC_0201]MBO1722436.1 amidohydrolase [Extibacter sp. GGCC_0201]BDF33697.1 5-methylthioadenosine/S-adenosylhomocysteine deaminase [Lachnospiraceae bacterium]BDF37701.1 5-methylthioadenosine/S-adenosylhomocysteine deaminase [Lachnospiraceae bacterium]